MDFPVRLCTVAIAPAIRYNEGGKENRSMHNQIQQVITVENTPLGAVTLAASEHGLTHVYFGSLGELVRQGLPLQRVDTPLLQQAASELAEYFAGLRREFTTPIDLDIRTPFHRAALQVVKDVPYGQVITYADLAARLGKPGAARAAGRAMSTNPLPIFIPCHRVVGRDGKLHGYSAPGGLAWKTLLLKLEGVLL
jgi:methylated-DNA-[protein]-cysteine S-methyltransferase